jgi:tetratricopeptide (TPR) repeat protein
MVVREKLIAGVEALQAGDARRAVERAEEAIRAQPEIGAAHLLLGRALFELDRAEQAAAALQKAVELDPDSGEAHASLGSALAEQGFVKEPYQEFIRALELLPDSAHVQLRAGNFLLQQGELVEAESLFALASQHCPVEALTGLVTIRELRGEVDHALALLEQNAEALAHSIGLCLSAARLLRRKGLPGEALALLESVPRERLSSHAEVMLQHALGDALDEVGDTDRAFAAWSKANELRGIEFDVEAHEARVREILERYPAGAFESLPRASHDSELPIFIAGVPRSGTSLVEEILASHPRVHGAGELDELNEIASGMRHDSQEAVETAAACYLDRLRELAAERCPDALRVTDKMPHNFLHLGLAAQLFPRARVVHCMRDPLDSGFSCFTRNFGASHDYATDQLSIGAFIRLYQELMAHWKAALPLPIHELCYEELVEEPERVSRALVEFCGLDWDPAVLRFYESRRPVRTASYAQVREPIYKTAVGRSRRYQRHLEPLQRELGG